VTAGAHEDEGKSVCACSVSAVWVQSMVVASMSFAGWVAPRVKRSPPQG